mmetsp:Transcript_9471/g.27881  ORF Transcript_9471/g.27881 Transcript_9471/m.27881 type:complete len:320 (+) Transcript_9471:1020-1979(+)
MDDPTLLAEERVLSTPPLFTRVRAVPAHASGARLCVLWLCDSLAASSGRGGRQGCSSTLRHGAGGRRGGQVVGRRLRGGCACAVEHLLEEGEGALSHLGLARDVHDARQLCELDPRPRLGQLLPREGSALEEHLLVAAAVRDEHPRAGKAARLCAPHESRACPRCQPAGQQPPPGQPRPERQRRLGRQRTALREADKSSARGRDPLGRERLDGPVDACDALGVPPLGVAGLVVARPHPYGARVQEVSPRRVPHLFVAGDWSLWRSQVHPLPSRMPPPFGLEPHCPRLGRVVQAVQPDDSASRPVSLQRAKDDVARDDWG